MSDQIDEAMDAWESIWEDANGQDGLTPDEWDEAMETIRQALERQRAPEGDLYRAIAGPLGELRVYVDEADTLSPEWKQALDTGLIIAGEKALDRVTELLAPEDQ